MCHNKGQQATGPKPPHPKYCLWLVQAVAKSCRQLQTCFSCMFSLEPLTDVYLGLYNDHRQTVGDMVNHQYPRSPTIDGVNHDRIYLSIVQHPCVYISHFLPNEPFLVGWRPLVKECISYFGLQSHI